MHRASSTFVIAALAATMAASPAIAQGNPDCENARAQYGDCDETEVTVIAPTLPSNPTPPPEEPFPGGTEGVIEIVTENSGDLPASSAPESGAPSSGVAATQLPTAYQAAQPGPGDETEAPVATLPDTGGEGWLLALAGLAMIGAASALLKLLIRE